MKLWYAALRDREDTDWGYGSLERTKAEKMALDMDSADAYIAATIRSASVRYSRTTFSSASPSKRSVR